MKTMPLLAMLVAVGAGDRSTAQHVQQGATTKTDTAFVALRQNMLASHARFDGALVVDLQQRGHCAAVITTTRGATPLRWKELGNLIVRLQNGRTLFRVPAGGQVHVLSAPTGDLATGINMGLDLYDEECGGV